MVEFTGLPQIKAKPRVNLPSPQVIKIFQNPNRLYQEPRYERNYHSISFALSRTPFSRERQTLLISWVENLGESHLILSGIGTFW